MPRTRPNTFPWTQRLQLIVGLTLLPPACARSPFVPAPAPCPPPVVNTSSWREVQEDGYSLRMPLDFRPVRVQPIDSHIRRWRSGRSEISVMAGPNVDTTVEPRGVEQGFSRCEVDIGGKRAQVATLGMEMHGDSPAGGHSVAHPDILL